LASGWAKSWALGNPPQTQVWQVYSAVTERSPFFAPKGAAL
jgi:hypothetical protein